ncbi:PorT family protein [Adhaeribacter sp. BT258]|uniref:PorT family protein n=1 Tax=Adhaeribacter terrigena TaxID=2793070 RepID=A0ABS1C1Y5_9BACT|nr:porin family protein [Adhaeribacter terrigena]MBK0403407.1 PorT family protein [Adhaeribacter terrigena]
MKKLLLPALLIFFTTFASAQSFRFGGKGGLNYTGLTAQGTNENAFENKLGWHAGLMVNIQYPGNTWFSIQPELLYTRKGYENFSDPVEIRDSQQNLLYSEQQGGLVRLNYLELPVMFNFRLGLLFLDAGPQLSYLVGYRNEAFITQTFPDGSETSQDSPVRQYSKDRLRTFDFGLAGGLRLQTLNGAALGIRYSQGFRKLDDADSLEPGVPAAPTARNHVFQVYVSYLLPE